MNIRQWLKGKRIGVLYGGRSTERDISLASGNAVLAALRAAGADAVGIDAGPDLAAQLVRRKIDFAYIALHGPGGEDGTVQGMLEVMGIPYTGCGVLASALSMDKVATKRMLDAAGLPTPRWHVLEKQDPLPRLRFPVVVKPSTQGSAIGVSIVRKQAELAPALRTAFRLDRQVLIEEYVAGTEITVGILGETPLPVIEIVPKNEFYDFQSKYTTGCAQHLIPPRLPRTVIRAVQALGLKVFRAVNGRALARIDMIVDRRRRPWVLEVNTIPGMTETSLLPDAARAAGLDFTGLVLKIIELSLTVR
jgi:D-alanine-D-alanine ligase